MTGDLKNLHTTCEKRQVATVIKLPDMGIPKQVVALYLEADKRELDRLRTLPEDGDFALDQAQDFYERAQTHLAHDQIDEAYILHFCAEFYIGLKSKETAFDPEFEKALDEFFELLKTVAPQGGNT